MNSVVAVGFLLLVVVATFDEVLNCPQETMDAVKEVKEACLGHMSTTEPSARRRRQDDAANDDQTTQCILRRASANSNLQKYTSFCSEVENSSAKGQVECIVIQLINDCPTLLKAAAHDNSNEEQEK